MRSHRVECSIAPDRVPGVSGMYGEFSDSCLPAGLGKCKVYMNGSPTEKIPDKLDQSSTKARPRDAQCLRQEHCAGSLLPYLITTRAVKTRAKKSGPDLMNADIYRRHVEPLTFQMASQKEQPRILSENLPYTVDPVFEQQKENTKNMKDKKKEKKVKEHAKR